MKRNTILIALLSFIMLSSCERIATVEVPETKSQPVLCAFLSPDESTIRVTLSMTRPVFNSNGNESIKYVDYAQVIISDQTGLSKTIPYSLGDKAYTLDQSEFPIKPGFTYTVVAKFDSYVTQGKTTVPNTVQEIEKVVSQNVLSGSMGENQILFSVKWKDEPGVQNYYRINFSEYYQDFGDTFFVSAGDIMVSDKNQDGETMVQKFEYYYYNGIGGGMNSFYAFMINCDYAYYEYHKRRLNYYGDDPFSEPAQQYSNVEGGLGVICSFRKSTYPIVS